jgi:hypothetical protein
LAALSEFARGHHVAPGTNGIKKVVHIVRISDCQKLSSFDPIYHTRETIDGAGGIIGGRAAARRSEARAPGEVRSNS